MKSEAEIKAEIQIELSKDPNVRLFNNVVGQFWRGKVVTHTKELLVVHHPVPVRAGLCVGSSDLIGWRTITITPEMVGKIVAVFSAVETKAGGRLTEDQSSFLGAVSRAGGFAGMARELAHAKRILRMGDL